MRRQRRLALAALLWCGAAHADPDILHYTISLHGIALLEGTFCFQRGATAYEAGLTAHTVGLVNVLFHGTSQLHVNGTIDSAGTVHPHAYAEHSRLSGQDYRVAIDFPQNDPVLRTQTPPQEKYRLPIPPAALPHAIDGLSAVVVQSLAAAAQKCPGDTRLYDGRQVRLLSMHDPTPDTLDRNEPVFAGRALRCDTDSTMLAGFLKSSSVQNQSKPRHGRIWLAPVRPDGPAIPVRMVFDADAFGDIVIQLDAASRASTPGCDGEAWAMRSPP